MNRVAIAGLNADATEKDISDLIAPYAEIAEIKILGRMNLAFVTLKDPAKVGEVIAKINGAHVCGQPIQAAIANQVERS